MKEQISSGLKYTVIIGLSILMPVIGITILMITLCIDLVLKGGIESALESVKSGSSRKASIKKGIVQMIVLGIIGVISIYAGGEIEGVNVRGVAKIVTIGITILNVRERIEGKKKGIKTVVEAGLVIGTAMLVVHLSEVYVMSNLIAIVCIIFGIIPGENSSIKDFNGNQYNQKVTEKKEINLVWIVASFFLALGGVSPYLLIGKRINRIGNIIIFLAAELVPLGKWLAGKQTGKTFITELLKAQEVVVINSGLIIYLFVFIAALFLFLFIFGPMLDKHVIKAFDKQKSLRLINMLIDGLIVYFLVGFNTPVLAFIVLSIFVIVRITDILNFNFLPGYTSFLLPAVIISLA